MRRLILGDVRAAVAEVLGVCSTDARVVTAVNLAQERLLNRSTDPQGSWMRYKVCAGSTNCFVMPRQVRHVKGWWKCGTPGDILPEWWESLGWWRGGRGLMGEDDFNGLSLIDRGTVCSFDNVIATTAEPRKIQVVASNASDNGKTIILRYIDSNGNRVYSSIGGVVQEGEQLTLSTSGSLTTSHVATGGLYNVVKAVTNYPVRLYSYDTNSAVQTSLLALYEPSETNPIYRSFYCPGFTDMAACPDASTDCTTNKALTFAVRLQHIPVVVDNDPLVVGNTAALVYMVRGHLMRLRNELTLAQESEMAAAQEIDGELAAYFGEGMQPVIKTPDSGVWGAGEGGVMNAI